MAVSLAFRDRGRMSGTELKCKRLTEVGEECFIVTVNINNGWVGHIGTLKGDEYVEDRSQIVWDFLKYCRDSDCMNSSSPATSDESDSEEDENQSRVQPRDHTGSQAGKQTEDSDSTTETDEWEPDEYVPEPSQSDRNLRSRDQQKRSRILIPETAQMSHDQEKGSGILISEPKQTSHDQKKDSRSLIPEALIEKVKEEMKLKRLSHQYLQEANKSPVPGPSSNKSPSSKKSPQYKSPLRKQVSYMRSRKRMLSAAGQHSKDRGHLKTDLKFPTRVHLKTDLKFQTVGHLKTDLKKKQKPVINYHTLKVKEKLLQCPRCPRRFKHVSLYHRHLEFHKSTTVFFHKETVY